MRLLGPVMLTATGRPVGRRSATPTQQIPASFSSRSMANPHGRASLTAWRNLSTAAPDDIPPDWIEDVEVVHGTGITALLSDARDCVLAAISRAQAAGVRVSFDVNYRSTLAPPDLAGPLLRRIAEAADLVFGGVEELRLSFPEGDAVDAAERLLRSGCSEVVLKQEAFGAAVYSSAGFVGSPGFTVDVVDTVGAGDAFVAGYLSGLLDELDVPGRLHRANACGAMLCMTPGDWESSPTLSDVERFCQPGIDPVLR